MFQLNGPRTRMAGQSAMSAVVDAQSAAPPRGALVRLLGTSPLTPDARVWYRSALGELMVGDRLEGLGRRWDVLHDIRHPDGVIDHLVIGPTGVFTVRTVHADGADAECDGELLQLGGQPSDAVREAGNDARTAERLLSAALGSPQPVAGLVVLVGASRLARHAATDRVRVVRLEELDRTISSPRRTLEGDEVARISDAAERADTWNVGVAAGEHADLHREFALVRERVRRAALARLVWGVAAFVTVCAFTWAMTATIITAAMMAVGSPSSGG